MLTRALAVAVLLAAAAGCGGDTMAPAVQASGSCAATAVYDGRRFLGMAVRLRRDLPDAVGMVDAGPAGCGDTSERQTLTRRRGIPASAALFGDDAGGRRRGSEVTLYAAVDAFPRLRRHPLHRYMFRGDEPFLDTLTGRHCRDRLVRGSATSVNSAGVSIAGRPLRFEAATRLSGRVVDGVPRLRERDAVRAVAARCPNRATLVARSVVVLP